jgi:hypothetical protein
MVRVDQRILLIQCDDLERNTVTVDHDDPSRAALITADQQLSRWSDSDYDSIRITGGILGTQLNLRANVAPLLFSSGGPDTVTVADDANTVHRIQAP